MYALRVRVCVCVRMFRGELISFLSDRWFRGMMSTQAHRMIRV